MTHKASLLRTTLLSGSGALISRLLGFARDAAMAWILGGSGAADALSAALRLPFLVRRLFGEGTLSLTLTTACVQEHLKGQQGLAALIARRLVWWGLPLLLLMLVLARPIMWGLAPGLGDRLDEAALLFRISVPYALLALVAGCGMAHWHSRNAFFRPALLPALFNGVVLLSAIPALAAPSMLQSAIWLSGGVLAGGVVQCLIALSALRLPADSLKHRPAPDTVQTVFRRLPAGILGAAVPQLAFLLASALASLLPEGHMATLFYAERLLEFPLGIIGAAIGMAAAPRLAELARRQDSTIPVPTAFALEVGRAEYLSLALNLPAAAGLAAVSTPLVALVLGHGAFDEKAVAATAVALCAYAPGLPAYALSRPLLAAAQALKQDRAPLRAGCAALLTTLVLGIVLTPLIHGWAAPLAVSAGLWCNVLLLRFQLRAFLAPLKIHALLPELCFSALVFAAAKGVLLFCPTSSASMALLLAVPSGVLVYLPMLFRLKKRLPHLSSHAGIQESSEGQ